VSSGYYGNQWVSSGYWGQVWNETSYYGQYWVYSGYYQSAWVDGYWWSYYYINGEDPSQDGWRYVWQDGYYYWQWVDTSHYEYGWVYSGYWSDGWIDTSHWVYQWVDTSGYVTSTTVQPVTNGAASTSVAITPSTVLGTYKVTLDVLTATSQTYTVWQTYTVATPPASPTATVATNLLGTGFTANWGGIAGATDYRLDLSTSSSFGTYVAGNQDRDVGTVTTFAVGGLASNTTYFYRMRALGPGGTSGNSNVVQLTTLPIITTQPASQVAVATTTVTFSVVVSPGTAPLTYQWRKGTGNLVNGGNVSGATSASLVLTSVLAVDAGSYSVVVTNNATGSVTSNAATLTIGVIDLQVHRPQ